MSVTPEEVADSMWGTAPSPKGAKGTWWTPDRVDYAVNHLQKNAGLSPTGALGLVSRWAGVESKGGPSSVNPNSGATGIGQWLGSRKIGVPSDFNGQLNHVAKELNSSESAAARRLRNAQTPEDAATGAAMYERAEGYNPKTGRDNFVTPTIRMMNSLGGARPDVPTSVANSLWSQPDTPTSVASTMWQDTPSAPVEAPTAPAPAPDDTPQSVASSLWGTPQDVPPPVQTAPAEDVPPPVEDNTVDQKLLRQGYAQYQQANNLPDNADTWAKFAATVKVPNVTPVNAPALQGADPSKLFGGARVSPKVSQVISPPPVTPPTVPTNAPDSELPGYRDWLGFMKLDDGADARQQYSLALASAGQGSVNTDATTDPASLGGATARSASGEQVALAPQKVQISLADKPANKTYGAWINDQTAEKLANSTGASYSIVRGVMDRHPIEFADNSGNVGEDYLGSLAKKNLALTHTIEPSILNEIGDAQSRENTRQQLVQKYQSDPSSMPESPEQVQQSPVAAEINAAIDSGSIGKNKGTQELLTENRAFSDWLSSTPYSDPQFRAEHSDAFQRDQQQILGQYGSFANLQKQSDAFGDLYKGNPLGLGIAQAEHYTGIDKVFGTDQYGQGLATKQTYTGQFSQNPLTNAQHAADIQTGGALAGYLNTRGNPATAAATGFGLGLLSDAEHGLAGAIRMNPLSLIDWATGGSDAEAAKWADRLAGQTEEVTAAGTPDGVSGTLYRGGVGAGQVPGIIASTALAGGNPVLGFGIHSLATHTHLPADQQSQAVVGDVAMAAIFEALPIVEQIGAPLLKSVLKSAGMDVAEVDALGAMTPKARAAQTIEFLANKGKRVGTVASLGGGMAAAQDVPGETPEQKQARIAEATGMWALQEIVGSHFGDHPTQEQLDSLNNKAYRVPDAQGNPVDLVVKNGEVYQTKVPDELLQTVIGPRGVAPEQTGPPIAREVAKQGVEQGADEIRKGLKKPIQAPVDFTAKGGNKIVDERGEPLAVYHGTNADFEGHDSAVFPTPGYFAKDPALASYVAETKSQTRGGNPNVRPTHLSLKNPIDLTRLDGAKPISTKEFLGELPFKVDKDFAEQYEKTNPGEQYVFSRIGSKDFIDYLKSKGYDGIVYHEGSPEFFKNVTRNNPVTDSISYVPFDKSQIKSAVADSAPARDNTETAPSQSGIAPDVPDEHGVGETASLERQAKTGTDADARRIIDRAQELPWNSNIAGIYHEIATNPRYSEDVQRSAKMAESEHWNKSPDVEARPTPDKATAPTPETRGTEGQPDSKPEPYSPEALQKTFNLTDEQTAATHALVQSMGLDTSRINLAKGGEVGEGALHQLAGSAANISDDLRVKVLKAFDMEGSGKSKSEIWRDTGWERGSDGKWRYEIPDNSVLKDDAYFVGAKKLPEVLDFPDLYQAYPALKEIDVRYTNKLGAGTRGALGRDENGHPVEIALNPRLVTSGTPEEVRSVIHHEIQHVIQSFEGFARGGSPERSAVQDFAARRDALSRQIKDQNEQLARMVGKPEYETVMSKKLDLVKEYQALEKEADKAGRAAANNYKALAGEVEARNVQKRLNLSEAGRKFLSPKETEDTDRNFQIVVQDKPLLFQGVKGAAELAKDGTAIIRGLESPDVSTAYHEIAHVARRQLFDRSLKPEQRAGITDADIRVAEQWSGAKDGKWTVPAEEKFARGFERYLRDGKSPSPKLDAIFAKVKDWFTGIYKTIKGSPIDVKISPEMRGVFDKLVTRDEPISVEQKSGPSRILPLDQRPDIPHDAPGVFWHGSDNGDLRGGTTGLHVGTYEAAKQALEARIGVPAEGEWDGTREYGKTLLAGKKTLAKPENQWKNTGHNAFNVPEEDYLPGDRKERAKYSNGETVPLDVKPVIEPVKITGKMTNTPNNPHEDFKANGYMKGALKKGNARNGYYYKNEGEDAGSISATLPGEKHIDRLWLDKNPAIQTGDNVETKGRSEPTPQPLDVPASYGDKNVKFTRDKAEAAKALLLKKFGGEQTKFGAGLPDLDAETIKAIKDIAGFHLEAGIHKLGDLKDAVAKEVGDWVRPHLDEMYPGMKDAEARAKAIDSGDERVAPNDILKTAQELVNAHEQESRTRGTNEVGPLAEKGTDSTGGESVKGGTPKEPATGLAGETGKSKIGQSIEAKAIEKGLTEGFQDTAQYDKKTVADQAARVSDLVTNRPDEMRSIIAGDSVLPKEINPSMFIDGVERHATATGDVKLLADLANSDVVKKTSEAAQTLRFAQEREPDSASALIQQVRNERAAKIAKVLNGRTVDQAIADETASLTKSVKAAKATINKTSWNKFLDQIQC